MLLGIDIGTTVLKVAVYSKYRGRLIAGHSQPLPTRLTPGDGREQDPAQLLSLLTDAIAQVRDSLGRRWKDIAGVGLASQGGSTLIVRRSSGEPLTPLILWNDPRAYPLFHPIQSSHKPSYWRSFYLRDEPGMGLARLEWLRQRDPGLLSDRNLYIGAGEHVFHFLTGEWRQDPCHALQTGCYDACTNRLTDKPLRGSGIALSFFPPLREGHTHKPLSSSCAQLFGLKEGIPVAGPYIDQEAGYMSTLGLSKRPLQMSLGTAWVGNFTVSPEFAPISPFQLAVPAPSQAGHLVILPLLTGNVTWDWALKSFVSPDTSAALVRQDAIFEESLLPPPGLVAIPWLNRPNPFARHLNGALLFSGISPSCGPLDLLRAAAAGMVYEMYRVLEKLRETGTVDCVILTGGASKGQHFQKLMATLFAPLPVQVAVDEDHAGTRGCLYSFGASASQVRTRVVKSLAKKYADQVWEGYHLYHEVFERIYGHETAGRPFQMKGHGTRDE